MRKGGLKIRLLAPLTIILGVIVAASVLAVRYYQHSRIEAEAAARTRYAAQLLQTALASDAQRMQAVLSVVMRDDRWRAALRARDRKALMQQSSALFDALRSSHGIAHFYFLSPEREVILRLHDPARFGDTIDRLTLQKAAERSQIVSGVELGVLGTLTLRAVSPWYADGELVGYVEVGETIGHLIGRLADILKVGLVVTVDKQFLEREGWEAGRSVLGLPNTWDDLDEMVVANSAPKRFPTAVVEAAGRTGGAQHGVEIRAGDQRFFRGSFVPLRDVAERPVGKLVVLKDVTRVVAEADRAVWLVAGMSAVLGVGLIALFFVIGHRAERALLSSQQALMDARDTLERRVAERTAALQDSKRRLEEEAEERRRAKEAWKASETRYGELVESANSIIMRRDLQGRITYINSFALAFFGYSEEEILGRSIVGTIVPKTESTGRDLAAMVEDISRHPEEYVNNENENMRRNGERVWIAWTNKAVRDADGELTEILSVGNDVTAGRLVEEELRLMASVFRNSLEGVVITDAGGKVLRVNDGFSDITGYGEDEVRGKSYRSLVADSEDQMLFDNLWQSLQQAGFWQGEIWNRRKNGEVYPQWLGVSAVRGEDGLVTHYIGVFTDMTEKKLSEKRIYRLAHYDALTDLPNRVLFQDRLDQAITQANRTGSQVALLYLDLDRFKPINDSLGHHVGDLLLKGVAERLRGAVRETDTVTRMGGDEFTIIVPGIEKARDIVPTASAIARKIVKRVSKAFPLDGHEVFVNASIGIACYPQDGETAADLVKNADSAMYHAKEQGGQSHMFYEERMNAAVAERLLMEQNLRKALQRNEFRLHYQPWLSLQEGEIRGVEALLRWDHPVLGMVAPDDFIPIAEDTGLIVPIGEWVLQEAVRQAKVWEAEGLPPVRIAVNLSLRQLRDKRLVKTVRRLLSDSGLEPQRLALEITESTLMEDLQETVAILKKLSRAGIHLLIDDFGVGYSSLSYLKRFPIHSVKIDRSFVRDIAVDANDAAIVAAIIAMAHQLRLRVVAEGVESEAQLAFLRSHSCDEIQGHVISEPLPPESCAEVLGGWQMAEADKPASLEGPHARARTRENRRTAPAAQ